MLNIRPTDFVLEIGSGNRPRKRSNVLCDKFLTDNYQRGGEKKDVVVDKRSFVIADGMELPFKDKSFDYVITSHILEHVDDPLNFISELSRVAKAGYIETPSEIGEKLFGWPFHKWTVRIEGDVIIMRRKKEESPFGDFFHKMYQKDPLFTEFVDFHYNHFYVQHEWKGRINLIVENDQTQNVKFNKLAERINIRSNFKNMEIKLARLSLFPFLALLRHFRKFHASKSL